MLSRASDVAADGTKTEQQTVPFETLYTVAELVKLWALSADTIRRLFEHEAGVLIFTIQKRGRRRYRTFRIPRSVAERVYRRLTTP